MSQNTPFKLAGVMGMPVLQSRSPIIHNYWIREHGLNAAYGHFPVRIERVEDAVRGLSALGLAGCNITQPHKLAAIGLMDWLSPLAQRIGAINCIVVNTDGSLRGFNFDAEGFIESLLEASPGWRGDNGPAVVLGAGGAARAVVCALIDRGATEIRLINRTRDRAEQLAALDPRVVRVHDWSHRHQALGGAALLVNTTNQGMYGQPPLDLALDALPHDALVCDLIYVPLDTPLVVAARARGNLAVNGLGMLLHQAVPAFEAWFGVRPRVTEALRNLVIASF
jgi:shikimate dehydrogenase